MYTSIISSIDELARLRTDWNRLAGGNPFRSCEWQFSWWSSFSEIGNLFVIVCYNDGQIIGIAPLYSHRNVQYGRTLRLLGTGKACSEYLGFLSRPEDSNDVQVAVADTLLKALKQPTSVWDRIEFDSIRVGELTHFVNRMDENNVRVLCRPGMQCWKIDLPSNWDDYFQRLSKSHRRKTRTLFHKLIETGKATVQTIQHRDEVEKAFEQFRLLHELRRDYLQEDNCFDTNGFAEFLSAAVASMAETGCVRFDQLMIENKCVAILFGIEQDGIYYVYQSGIDPEFLKSSPGWLLNSLVIKDCIERGLTGFDLLRGDEPYKSNLGLTPQPVHQFVMYAPKPMAILRHTVDAARERFKEWRGSGTSGL